MKKISFYFFAFFICCAFGFQSSNGFFQKLALQAVAQTKIEVRYDPAYVNINYPGGDVPANTGVCTDLVIRAYRGLNIDLQKEVHEDMVKNFALYPKLWKLKAPDSNIDHRRVPNLMTFFKRKNAELKISDNATDYLPGDLVTWNLQGHKSMSGITHIGVVSNIKNSAGNTYLIAHNIGNGNQLEDVLFNYTIIGHYRYGK